MMIPSRFTLRRSGMMVLDHHRCTKESTDCRFCAEWHKRRRTAGRCKWIVERMRAGAVSFGELIDNCFRELTSPDLRNRLHTMAVGFYGSLYCSDEYVRRLRHVLNRCG